MDQTSVLGLLFDSSSLPLPVSPVAQFQEEDNQDMYVAEQELTNEELIERLQEHVVLVDMLTEREIIERKLMEVRNLEERLQEVDEIAAMLQEVIEEELSKDEIDKLRAEVEQEMQLQAEAMTGEVLKKSVQMIKEDEVDELEDQIKEVFLKGLLPEEGEVEMKQEGKNELTEDSQSDEGLREKLSRIEKEWKNEVEEKSADVAGNTFMVTYQKVEFRTMKPVPIVEERRLKQGEVGYVQLQTAVTSEEGFVKKGTGIEVDFTEREGTQRLQLVDPAQVADKDVWFILFDCSPYKADFKPPGKVCLPDSSLLMDVFCVMFT